MSKGRRALIEAVESRQLLASIAGLVWNDLNGDRIKDTREKWFSLDGTNQASIRLYADLSGNGVYDAGEPSTVVTKEGAYKINLPNVGVFAVRTDYKIDSKTQKNTAVFGMVPVVVVNSTTPDLTGVNVPLEKGAVVSGTFYTDEDADGTLDTNEVKRGRSQVFYDRNDDGVRQNEEPFVPLGAAAGSTDYKYQIRVPLGEVKLRVVEPFETSPANADPVVVTAEAGKFYSQDFRIVPEMKLQGKLFNDLNGNGKRNKGEPYVSGIRTWFDYNQNKIWEKGTEPSAVSGSDGSYELLTRKSSATFGVNVLFRSTPTINITSTLSLSRITFKTIQETQTYSFGFKPAGVSVQLFNDPNGSGVIDAGDSPLPGVIVFADKNHNGIQNSGESAGTSGDDGIAKVENLGSPTGQTSHKLVVRLPSKYIITSDLSVLNVTLNPFEQKTILVGVKLKPA